MVSGFVLNTFSGIFKHGTKFAVDVVANWLVFVNLISGGHFAPFKAGKENKHLIKLKP